jgi:hypothetical protein
MPECIRPIIETHHGDRAISLECCFMPLLSLSSAALQPWQSVWANGRLYADFLQQCACRQLLLLKTDSGYNILPDKLL